MKKLIFLLALLNCATMWGNDGDKFVAKSIEGIEITFTVISEAEKTCEVGTGIYYNSAAIGENQTGVLTIPESANGYSVVGIGKGAFYKCQIEKLHLPNTIKTIKFYAFYHCQLTSIVLPESLEYIEWRAFEANTSLATITVRSSVPFPISNAAFYDESPRTYTTITLYVPEGMASGFKADSEWGRFRTIKEGEPLSERPTDIAYPEDFETQYAEYVVLGNNSVTVNVNFINERTTPVSSISYVTVIDGVEGEEQTYEFPQPIAANGEPFTLPVILPDFEKPILHEHIVIDVTKMNGVPVDYGADIRPNAVGAVCVFIPASDHKVLIKDYAHPKCLWTLRTNIGFEKLKEKYGDKVIRTSIHVGGPMWCNPVSYIPFTPTCHVDGYSYYGEYQGQSFDPYYGEGSSPLGIIDIVEDFMNRPHLGQVKILSAQWADADSTKIDIVSEATFGMDKYKNAVECFSLLYTLVEDGLKGNGSEWEQLNGYSGQTTDDPNLQPLTSLPYTITDMVYNDVAVRQGSYRGVFRSFICGEPQQETMTLSLPENIIQDKSKLSVVVTLQDQTNNYYSSYTGVPVDSDKSPIAAFSSGIQSITQSATPHDVYDLSGRKVKSAATTLDNLPKGIYIYGGKKIVIGR